VFLAIGKHNIINIEDNDLIITQGSCGISLKPILVLVD
jgi:hypothetical protein